jgi:hypothetical protein
VPEACPYNNYFESDTFPPSCPSCTFVDKKTPDRNPAQQLTLGRHGPYRDANRLQRLFLLLLSLEESNQRTCEILTHDALSTPRAESFGGVNENQTPSRATCSPKLYPFECICPPHTAEDFAGAGFAFRRVLVSWSGPQHPGDVRRASARHTHGKNMPDYCPHRNCFDGRAISLRALRVSSRTKRRRTGVRRNSLHWGVTAHAVTQTQCSVCSCCYFLWKKVTKELCGIGTHASIATPRAVGFGA